MKARPSFCSAFPSLCLLILALLSGCDGGLFGTGSGDEPGLPADAGEGGLVDGIGEAPAPDGTDTTTSSDDTAGSDTADAQTDGDDTLQTQSFSNTLVGSDRSQPLLTVVNASDRTVSLAPNGVVETVAPGASSEHLALSPGLNSVGLFETDTATGEAVEFARIEPLNVAEATLTTLIVRSAGSGLDVLPLASQGEAGDLALARVRVVIGGELRLPPVVEFLLQPSSENGGSAETRFPALSFTRPVSDYQDMPPGRYDLYDPTGALARIPLSLEAGRVYTLVLGAATDRVLIEIDSAIGNVVSDTCNDC